MEIDNAFTDAVARVQLLDAQPSHVQLNLYGLFKQAKNGNVTGSRPGVFDMRGRAKYDAWSSNKGMSTDDAKLAYIEVVEELGA